MKKILLILTALFATVSCDKIPADDRWQVSDKLPDWNGQYVLLEDFTGVGCSNCPEAAEEIERLKAKFGDKLIVVGMHGQFGNFNRPLVGDSIDLRNAQAEEYRLFYNISSLPNGIIMHEKTPIGKDQFYSSVLKYYTRKAAAEINIEAGFASNNISINTDILFVDNYTGSGNTQLTVMIIEDGIIVRQLNHTTVIDGYSQDHVFRGMATPLWGDQITGSSVATGSSFNHNATMAIDAKWQRSNLSVVAVLFDNETKEVIQCASAKIN